MNLMQWCGRSQTIKLMQRTKVNINHRWVIVNNSITIITLLVNEKIHLIYKYAGYNNYYYQCCPLGGNPCWPPAPPP
jgi:hypothetical protein